MKILLWLVGILITFTIFSFLRRDWRLAKLCPIVLDILGKHNELEGERIREILSEHGMYVSPDDFHFLMERVTDSGAVIFRSSPQTHNGYTQEICYYSRRRN